MLFGKRLDNLKPDDVVRIALDDPAIRRGVRQWTLYTVIMVLVSGVLLLVLLWGEGGSARLWGGFILIATLLATVWAIWWSLRRWRPFELDNEGVSTRSERGEPLRLRWSEVERVRFYGGLTLVGGATRVRLAPLPLLSPASGQRVHRKVRHHLAPHFDLQNHRPWEQYGWRGRAGRFALLLAYLLCHGALTLGALWYLIARTDRVQPNNPSGFVLVFIFSAIFGPILLVLPWILWWHHRHNPAWRVRRK